MEVDNISELTSPVTELILSQLSLKEAVRTSILSSKWRYKWVFRVDLVFDHSVLVPSRDSATKHRKLVDIVDHVLSLHSGSINKFKISHKYLQAVEDIDRWILFLSTRSVGEFVLHIHREPRYTLPTPMYLCEKLVHFEVFNCVIKPPPSFGGFKSLKTLLLQKISLDQDVLEKLISSCTLLERLALYYFDGISHLNIVAPNLQILEVAGSFDAVNLESTSKLEDASFVMHGKAGKDQDQSSGGSWDLIKFFNSLPHIQRLKLKGLFVKFLTVGVLPKRLPFLCMELNYLSLHIDLDNLEECLAALCILRSSPNLQELVLWVHPNSKKNINRGAVGNDVKGDHQFRSFNNLRLVNISHVSGRVAEMEFISFLLGNSPVLERMTIKPSYPDSGGRVKRTVRFLQASVQAEVIYVDPLSSWEAGRDLKL